MTRSEHLQWCKDRALKIASEGDITQAFTSMSSDLNKHPETLGHIGIQLGMMQLMAGNLSTEIKMTEFINGFN